MNIESCIPFFLIITFTILWIKLAAKLTGYEVKPGKYKSIDGLRGLLAFFVFFHHSVIWYFFLHNGQWGFPPSHLYRHLGPSSVSLFFMITAFLFFTRLRSFKRNGADWLKLYTGRFFRILPLYFTVVILLFIIAGAITRFTLLEPGANVVMELGKWLLFMEPDINGIGGTRILVAGVVWSLAYEWLFYFSLPLLGMLFFQLWPSFRTLICALLCWMLFGCIILYFYQFNILLRASFFIGGIIAGLLSENTMVQRIAKTWYASLLIIALLVLVIVGYPDIDSIVPYSCMVLSFILIANGNSIFGLLNLPATAIIGQLSYSIYLLHGMLLFCMFHFVLGHDFVAGLSPVGYWCLIAAISIVLMTICFCTYHLVEKRFLEKTPAAVKWAEKYLRRKS
ncbi:acyltransferase [Chitinophaga sp. Cy-1792]|uniref:acyltransferase family protein n=1 Tax=Chitinophaga sp. Cy-1792 TaxID=2608339 RepID=UPI00142133E8|nr:acyltransferase [Chitinophaga sp. Cy-1792]NIG55131.1 acyltransferase [Chitinophaga sp. Cy-1792]